MGRLDLRIDPLQRSQYQVPTDQIIQVMGQNSVASGINQASDALSKVLQRRAELKRQAKQTAAVEKGLGLEKGTLDPSLSPELGLRVHEANTARIKAGKEEKAKQSSIENIRAVERSRKLPEGSLGDDPTTARTLLAQYGSDERQGKTLEALEDQRKVTNELRTEAFKKSVVDKFTSDPSVRKAQTSLEAAGDIRGLALSGNPIGAAAIPTFSARMAGEVGALTEADKAPFGGSRAIVSRLQASLKQMADGKLTEENAKFIIDLTNLIEKRAGDKITNLAKTRARQYSKGSKILNEQELFDALNPGGANAVDSALQGLVDEGLVNP